MQARKGRTSDRDRQRKTERETETEVLSSRALRELIFGRGEKSDACEMACEAEKKLGPSCYELYGGMMFGGGKVHGSVAGKIDRFQGWSRFNAATLGETHCIGSSYNAAAKDDKQQKKLHGNVVPGSSVVEELGTDNTSAASIKSFRSSSCSSSSYPSGKATAVAAAAATTEMNKGGSSSSTISSKIQNSSSSSLGHRRGGTCDMGSLQNHKGFATAAAGEASSSGSESGRSSAGSDSGRYFSTGSSSSKDAAATAGVNGRNVHHGAALPSCASHLGISSSSPSKENNSKDTASTTSSSSSSSSRGGGSVAGSPTVERRSSSSRQQLLHTGGGTTTSSLLSQGSPCAAAAAMATTGSTSCRTLGPTAAGVYTGGLIHSGGGVAKKAAATTTSAAANGSEASSTSPAAAGKVSASNGKVMCQGGVIFSGNGSCGGGNKKTGAMMSRASASHAEISTTSSSSHAAAVRVEDDDFVMMQMMLASVNPEEVKMLGNEQYKRGKFAEALALYERAIVLAPGQAAYHSNRAAALTGLGRLAEAVCECQEAIKLDPTYLRAHHRLGSLYFRLGRFDGARNHFRIAGQQTDLSDMQRLEKVEKHLAKCLAARKSCDWNSVIRESDAAVVAGADCASKVFAFKAEALLKLHRHEEADTVVSAAQKVETTLRKCRNVPADTTMLLVQSEIDMALGRFEAAVIAAENAAHIDPKNMEVMLKLQKARAVASARTLGNDLYKAGKMLEASVAYSEGLQYDPINAILLCNRAACRSKLGHFEKAVEDCNAALEAQPRYMKALLRRADSNFKMERWDKALKDYESLRKDMPGNVDIAKALFEVQIALKKSRGEETDDMHFGGVVEDVCTNEQLRHAVSLQGMAVVQFNTIWSEQCRQMASFVEQLSKLNPTVNFVKVDVEESPYLAKAENVKFVPTFKIYKNGFKVKELLGPSQQALEIAIGHFSL